MARLLQSKVATTCPAARPKATPVHPGCDLRAGESAKFDVKTDLLEVVKDMRKRNVPTFADGYYRCIVDPTAMMHLRQNADFREIARYPGPRSD